MIFKEKTWLEGILRKSVVIETQKNMA